MKDIFDEDDYVEGHNESRESMMEPRVTVCPIGDRPDCKFFHCGGDEDEFWCEHPSLGKGEDIEVPDLCPLEEDDEDEE